MKKAIWSCGVITVVLPAVTCAIWARNTNTDYDNNPDVHTCNRDDDGAHLIIFVQGTSDSTLDEAWHSAIRLDGDDADNFLAALEAFHAGD